MMLFILRFKVGINRVLLLIRAYQGLLSYLLDKNLAIDKYF